jgi:hypothetical protein
MLTIHQIYLNIFKAIEELFASVIQSAVHSAKNASRPAIEILTGFSASSR